MIARLNTSSIGHARIALAVAASLAGATMLISPQAATASSVQSTDRGSYVYLAPGGRSSTMSGSTEDMRRAEALRSSSEGLLFVRHAGAAYVIRDTATLRQAEALFEPQRAVGARQGELGRRQGELGRRQGQLGAEQGRLGRLQAASTPRQAGDLGRQQAELGRRQGELGRQQGELGREQARLARIAGEKLQVLVAEAIRRGVAQRVN
jgi:hypothetical protein